MILARQIDPRVSEYERCGVLAAKLGLRNHGPVRPGRCRRGGRVARYLLRRLGLGIVTLWILSLIVFFAGQILPGNPARAILGPLAAPSAVRALNHQLGVDRPLVTQYLGWLGGLLHGYMGKSYTYQAPVEPFIRAALTNSAKLAALALVIIIPLGILGGVIAALNYGGVVD